MTKTPRFLIAFNAKQIETENFMHCLQRYQLIINQLKQTNSAEWELVYVTPAIPAYCLLSKEIVQLIYQQEHESLTVLRNLGRILNIPLAQQHLRQGQIDLQLNQLAKQINATSVIGYSNAYLKLTALQQQLKRSSRLILKKCVNYLYRLVPKRPKPVKLIMKTNSAITHTHHNDSLSPLS